MSVRKRADVPETIIPKFVPELIAWATEETEAVEIEWNGERYLEEAISA